MYLFPFIFFLALLFSIVVKSSKGSVESSLDSFWEKEQKANNTPAKDITNLDYITISLNVLPFLDNPSETVAECEKTIRLLAEKPILNLNGISNTDLKLQYGVTNLSRLSQYDENYSAMQRTFAKWGRALYEAGYLNEAVTVLEYALDLGCDAKNIFLTLKEIYIVTDPDKIQQLKLRASVSNTPLRNHILEELDS